ncbi:MAG TPA: hypothetical protein VNI02_06840 [Blastocatellia bacterium]|jgi:hypothetical protein|nr:hypothetical protein [Blastocatellia bacterium]
MKRATGFILGLALTFAVAVAAFVEPSGSPVTQASAAPALVYVKGGAKKYHNQDCRDLQRVRASELISMNRDDAEAAGYTACRNPKCFPR